jgi:hypothetical protein
MTHGSDLFPRRRQQGAKANDGAAGVESGRAGAPAADASAEHAPARSRTCCAARRRHEGERHRHRRPLGPRTYHPGWRGLHSIRGRPSIIASSATSDPGSQDREVARGRLDVRCLCRLRHIYTRPYTPRTNGKAERFIQTALREWAYARAYNTSRQRAADLPIWLHRYNWHRPHGSIGHRPPVSRLGLTEDNLLRLHT